MPSCHRQDKYNFLPDLFLDDFRRLYPCLFLYPLLGLALKGLFHLFLAY